MIDRPPLSVAIRNREPRPAVTLHRAPERIHPEFSAQVRLTRLAVNAVLALAIEDGNHVVPLLNVLHSISDALHHSAYNYIYIEPLTK